MIVRYFHYACTTDEAEAYIERLVKAAHRAGQIKKYLKQNKGRVTKEWPVVSHATVAKVYADNWKGKGKPLAVGYAFVSHLDQFNRAKGRTIALGRALKWAKRNKVEITPGVALVDS